MVELRFMLDQKLMTLIKKIFFHLAGLHWNYSKKADVNNFEQSDFLSLLTVNKEWLFLTFFPQENTNELNRLRENLTPFLIAVTKALAVELEVNANRAMRKSIIDQVLQNIPAEASTPTTRFTLGSMSDTLHAEFDGLLNLRYCLSYIPQFALNYSFNRCDNFRSFQHVDNFKQTSHMMNTFDASNSNLSDMQRTQGRFILD